MAKESSSTEQSGTKLYEHSAYVHVGEGAEECTNATNGKCKDDEHFHAWIRKPNPFQDEEIKEQAFAAKGRRMRQFTDPDTNAYAILEGEMEELRQRGEREPIIQEILNFDIAKDKSRAVKEVSSWEQFDGIDKDLERLDELINENAKTDERTELEKHANEFDEAVEKELEKAQNPRREALEGMELDALIDEVKRLRIEVDSYEKYNAAYQSYLWTLCTLKPVAKGRPHEQVFESVSELQEASEEVIMALARKYHELFQGSLGNG